MPSLNVPGTQVYYVILEHKHGDGYYKKGEVGPYVSREVASKAFDDVVASREGEQLLELLEVDRIRVMNRIVT